MIQKFQNSSTKTVRVTAQKRFALIVFFAAAILMQIAPASATIDNTATASATYNGNPVVSLPDTASVPVDPTAGPGLVVSKTADDTTDVVAGQLVSYTYVVRNSGSQTLTNISLNDSHNGAGPAPVPGNETLTTDAGIANDSTDTATNDGVWSVLAPGDAVTMTATYTVKQADVDSLQ